jgi:hypothetical protein
VLNNVLKKITKISLKKSTEIKKNVLIHDKFTGLEKLFRLVYGFYGYGFMFPVVTANSYSIDTKFSKPVMCLTHWLNMELDLQSLFGLHGDVHSCLYPLAETPQLPPPPAFRLIYEGAIGQPR